MFEGCFLQTEGCCLASKSPESAQQLSPCSRGHMHLALQSPTLNTLKPTPSIPHVLPSRHCRNSILSAAAIACTSAVAQGQPRPAQCGHHVYGMIYLFDLGRDQLPKAVQQNDQIHGSWTWGPGSLGAEQPEELNTMAVTMEYAGFLPYFD